MAGDGEGDGDGTGEGDGDGEGDGVGVGDGVGDGEAASVDVTALVWAAGPGVLVCPHPDAARITRQAAAALVLSMSPDTMPQRTG